MRRRFVTLDVFTDRRFAGNPLAVVLDADGLDGAAMQAIAREFNLSETVFVLPPEGAGHRARYRIFTPAAEVAFAGHPTVGTAVLLARLDGGAPARPMTLEANIGPVSCRAEPRDAGRGRARFDVPKLPEEAGAPPPVETLAAALGIDAGDIGFDGFAPSCWSAGVPLTFVPLKSRAAVARARPDLARFAADLAAGAHRAIFLYSREAVDPGSAFHARMFAPAYGIIEDPATGAAAAAFAAVLTRFAGWADGEHTAVIEQGYEMGRPSRMTLAITIEGGRLAAASVGGDAVVVSEGAIEA
jgi:trans-2,3-dihydro-3-hydroxyanthranilate isomerase